MVWFKYNYKNWMHSFEVSLGYESVDRTTFSTWSASLPRFIENVLRSTLSYPNETSKEYIQFLIVTSSCIRNVCDLKLIISTSTLVVTFIRRQYQYVLNWNCSAFLLINSGLLLHVVRQLLNQGFLVKLK